MTDDARLPETLADGEVIVTTAAHRNKDKRYHTDPNCRFVAEMKAPRIRQRDSLGDVWEECDYCGGTVATDDGRDWSAYNLATSTDWGGDDA
jgi:hypothetical protein